MLEELRHRLLGLEQDLDNNRYQPGHWLRLIEQIRKQPRGIRSDLAPDITRVSEKLHLHNLQGYRTRSFRSAIALEAAGTAAGAVLVGLGVANRWDWTIIAAAVIWALTIHPLLKVGTGFLLGVRYSYVYRGGINSWINPRFKMRYGTYLALQPWARVALHFCGAVGTPMGIAVAWAVGHSLPSAPAVGAVSAAYLGFELFPFFAVVFALRSIVPRPMLQGSAANAALELREALGLAPAASSAR